VRADRSADGSRPGTRSIRIKENSMYASISQEITRQHREDIKHAVAAARQAGTARAKSEPTSRLVRSLRWELSRYAGLVGKRLRK